MRRAPASASHTHAHALTLSATEPPPAPANGSRKRAADGAGGAPAHPPEEEELHSLRAEYRSAIDETEANKEQLSRPEDPGLLAILKRGEKLFEERGGARAHLTGPTGPRLVPRSEGEPREQRRRARL